MNPTRPDDVTSAVRPDSLGPVSRALTAASAACFAVLGVVLFLAPGWASANFAWTISPFVTMTMGGWCLGNAVIAGLAAKLWRWSTVSSALVYLWVFGILQLTVLLVFRANVLLGSALAGGYVLTLGVTVLGAAVGVVELVRRAPCDTDGGRRPSGWLRVSVAVFVLLVGVLAVGGSRAGIGGLSSQGSVFPEHLSLFTIRAFAAFFGALAIGALPLIWARTVTPTLHFARSGLALIVPILAAAAFYASAFDLVGRPGGWAYLGAYLAVGVAVCIALRVYRPVPAREVASGS